VSAWWRPRDRSLRIATNDVEFSAAPKSAADSPANWIADEGLVQTGLRGERSAEEIEPGEGGLSMDQVHEFLSYTLKAEAPIAGQAETMERIGAATSGCSGLVSPMGGSGTRAARWRCRGSKWVDPARSDS
jgi:hypothetical protein